MLKKFCAGIFKILMIQNFRFPFLNLIFFYIHLNFYCLWSFRSITTGKAKFWKIKERKSKSKNENKISQKALGSQTWSNWDFKFHMRTYENCTKFLEKSSRIRERFMKKKHYVVLFYWLFYFHFQIFKFVWTTEINLILLENAMKFVDDIF